MKNTLSLALILLMVIHLVPSAFGEDSVASQITAIPMGARIELRLKNKPKVRGTRGPVSGSGFTLINAGTRERRIAFVDVSSVRQITERSHTGRNILIVAGIGVAVVAITAALLLRCGPFGCNSKL